MLHIINNGGDKNQRNLSQRSTIELRPLARTTGLEPATFGFHVVPSAFAAIVSNSRPAANTAEAVRSSGADKTGRDVALVRM
jgi:hypothetical protein